MDLDHDIKNNQPTLVTYVKTKRKNEFVNYTSGVTDLLVRNFKEVNKDMVDTSPVVSRNLGIMVEKESGKIIQKEI